MQQQKGTPADKVGSIHQNWRETLKRVIFRKSLDQSPHLNLIDLYNVNVFLGEVRKSPITTYTISVRTL